MESVYAQVSRMIDRWVQAEPGSQRLPQFATHEQETATEYGMRLARNYYLLLTRGPLAVPPPLTWMLPGESIEQLRERYLRSLGVSPLPVVTASSPANDWTAEDILRREG